MINFASLKNLSIAILMMFMIASCGEKKQVVAPPQKITVVEAVQEDVSIYNEFVGEVYGEKDIPIRARVEGYLEGMYFEEGSEVKAGQLLYSIDPLPYQAKVNAQESGVAEAETMMVKAKSDLDRYIPLAKLNAVSKSDLDAAQAEYDANVANVEAAKANLQSAQIELGYTKIYSQIDGIIGMTKARVGDFVGKDPNPVILNTVSQTNHVKVRFSLTESDYLFIAREYEKRTKENLEDPTPKSERKADIEIILSDGSTYKHKGKIDFIDRGIDANTGSILIQADFPNPDLLLRPGLYAKVRLAGKRLQDAVVVPVRCVMELQGLNSVFVVNDSNVVHSRQIIAGPTVGDYVVVDKGLKAGEKIVINALQNVKEGMIIQPELTEFKSKSNQQLN